MHSDDATSPNASIKVGTDASIDLASMGLHRIWKRRILELSGAKRGDAILDISANDRSLANRFARIVGQQGLVAMAHFAPANHLNDELKPHPALQALSVDRKLQSLPWTTPKFDVISVSFCLLSELCVESTIKVLAKLLKPGARLLVLDFAGKDLFESSVNKYSQNPVTAAGLVEERVAKTWRKTVRTVSAQQSKRRTQQSSSGLLPLISSLLLDQDVHFDQLEQCAKAVNAGPSSTALAKAFHNNGLGRCQHHPLNGGLFALHRGYRS